MLLWEVWKITGHVIDGEMKRDAFLDAPHFESIRRVRQKIQEKYPHLQSSKEVLAHKRRKQSTKGTFIDRETITPHYEFIGDKVIMKSAVATDKGS